MATNYIQPGDTLALAAPTGGVTSGGAYLFGNIFGVAIADAAETVSVAVAVTGVWELPKVGSQAWTAGDRVYWNGTACSNLAVGRQVGVATEAVGSGAGETLGKVRLDGAAAAPAPVAGFTMAAAAAGANVSEVTITATDGDGRAIAEALMFDLWLSDATTGAGLTGTTASGTVTAKSAAGIVVDTYTAKKAIRVQTLATGVFILEITDTAKTAFKVCAQAPGTGRTIVGATLATASYG